MSAAVTTYNKGKPFSFSYSKLKNVRACPKKYLHVDVLKDVKEDESEILTWGNLVHKAFADRLGKNKPLPIGMTQYESMLTKVEQLPGKMVVEQKYALRENDLTGCEYFARDAWFRIIADVVVFNDNKALAIDWKLGKIIEDSMQLALVAAAIFGHYPDLKSVTTSFFWLKDEANTRQDFTRADMPAVWAAILPEVKQLKSMHDTMTFPAKPGGLCSKWCPVLSCEHNGSYNG